MSINTKATIKKPTSPWRDLTGAPEPLREGYDAHRRGPGRGGDEVENPYIEYYYGDDLDYEPPENENEKLWQAGYEAANSDHADALIGDGLK
jgi:hypothetical protein